MAQNLQPSKMGVCPDCFTRDEKCDTCFVVAEKNEMILSLKTMLENRPEKSLSEMTVEMAAQEVIANDTKGKEMLVKLKGLAREYSQLELETQRAVMTIRRYGENCKEAAVDFLEDGNVRELMDELGDIEEMKENLEKATNKHNDIL
jgi:hypothetical protein